MRASSPLLELKRAGGVRKLRIQKNGVYFRESVCNFSLGFWPIGLSVFDGARRKVVLRG